MRSHRWTRAYTLALAAFTLFLALDTFAVPKVYRQEVSDGAVFEAPEYTETQALPAPAEASPDTPVPGWEKLAETENPPETTASEDSAQDACQVTLTQTRVGDTEVYVADVRLPSVQSLKTALAQGSYGRNLTETTSAMAQAHNVLLAINGDYYGARERGYVIRNGVLYRDSAGDTEALCIWSDGRMEIVDPEAVSAQTLLEQGAWQVLSFGPALLDAGEIQVSETEEVGRAKASNPRTAVGMIEPLHYVFVVSDGRTEQSEGLSLYELADFMRSLGVQTAYNLDGGGSSTMVYQGELVNQPTTGGSRIRERGVSDIVYIA